MTKLQNFVFGTFVAIILMGPAAWSGARQAVANTESVVVAVIAGSSMSDTQSSGDSTIRSATLPTP
jgi:hypothetical protein